MIRVELSLIFFCTLLAAPLASALTLSGDVQMWNRPICPDENPCALPAPMGLPHPVTAELKEPVPGQVSMVSFPLEADLWRLHLAFFWARPELGPPYVVTQIQIRHVEGGLIAECSRYDAIESVSPFPPGSCSGRWGEQQVGVSLARSGSNENASHDDKLRDL